MRDRVRRQRVVGDADGELGDDVGRGRRDQQQIGPARQLDVIDAAVTGVAPLLDDDAVIRRPRPARAARRIAPHSA